MTRYKVTARTGFRQWKEGEEFDAELTEDQERRAKERGSIKIVPKTNKTKGKEGEDE